MQTELVFFRNALALVFLLPLLLKQKVSKQEALLAISVLAAALANGSWAQELGRQDRAELESQAQPEPQGLKKRLPRGGVTLGCGGGTVCRCRTQKSPPFPPIIACGSPTEVHPYYTCRCEPKSPPQG